MRPPNTARRSRRSRCSDTVKRVTRGDGRLRIVETIPRESIFLAQTPQGFRVEVLREAIALGESGVEATDEAALAERAGHVVHIVEATAEEPEDHDGRRSGGGAAAIERRPDTNHGRAGGHRLRSAPAGGRPSAGARRHRDPGAVRRARSFRCRRRLPRRDRRHPRRRVARRHRPAFSGHRSALEGCVEHRPAASGRGDDRTRPGFAWSTWTSSSSSRGRRSRRTCRGSAPSWRAPWRSSSDRVSVKGKTNEGRGRGGTRRGDCSPRGGAADTSEL